MKRDTKVGVVGAGHWGKNLLRNFHKIGVLDAFCETDPETRRTAAETYTEAQSYNDYESLLNDPSVNAVAIATPAVTHANLATQAINAESMYSSRNRWLWKSLKARISHDWPTREMSR